MNVAIFGHMRTAYGSFLKVSPQTVLIKATDVNVKMVTNKSKFASVIHIQIILSVSQDVSQIVLKAC